MEFQKAMEWVNDNKNTIRSFIGKYRNFSPYDECDYMQEAFEAAMIAAVRSRQKQLNFEATFWKVFRNQISVLTPSPGMLTHGSNSIPSHLCTDDFTVVCGRRVIRKQNEPDTEAIFYSVCHHLTEKEQQVLYLSLGIGMEGKMSNYEIADQMGCVVSNVRETFNRSLDRIKTLVDKGRINPERFLNTQAINHKHGVEYES